MAPPPPGTYRFSLAENGMTILFSRGISAMCFDTRRFQGVMGIKYSESSSRVMAFDNAVQAMYRDKVTPDAGGQYWGAPQGIHLREKCTGTPVIHTYVYPTSFKIEGARQYNTLAHCRVQLAVQRISRSAPNHSRVINLFNIQLPSQESRCSTQSYACVDHVGQSRTQLLVLHADAVQRHNKPSGDQLA